MNQDSLLIAAMAQQCRTMIQKASQNQTGLPESLQRKHLIWMCDQIESKAEEWRVPKLHRWIGFIQGGMLANRMIDLNDAKMMFQTAKTMHRIELDEDLLDHLDPRNSFEIDLGGQG